MSIALRRYRHRWDVFEPAYNDDDNQLWVAYFLPNDRIAGSCGRSAYCFAADKDKAEG